jgi:hypothetical protein
MPGTVTTEMFQRTVTAATRLANTASYNLEDPNFGNILELVEDNPHLFLPTSTALRFAAQARHVILRGGFD